MLEVCSSSSSSSSSWSILPFLLSVLHEWEKVWKNCERRKTCPWLSLSLPLCMRESERGNSTHSTAVGSRQYFLILTAVLSQTVVAPDPSFSPSYSLRRAQHRTTILVSCASGHSGRGQALGQHPAPNTWVNCTTVFFFSLAFNTNLPSPSFSWLTSLSSQMILEYCFIFIHCFTALKVQWSLFWIEDVIGDCRIGIGKFEIGKTEVILYNKSGRKWLRTSAADISARFLTFLSTTESTILKRLCGLR